MSICSRVILVDEFDWGYIGFYRSDVIEEVLTIIPHAILEADIAHCMIFDINKASPETLIGKVTADAIYVMTDTNVEIRKIA